MTGAPQTNAALERARTLLEPPMSRDRWDEQGGALAADGFVREDRRRLVALPDATAEEFREQFRAWFDIGDGEPFFVFEDVVGVGGERLAAARLHIAFKTGDRGDSHIVLWQFDEHVDRMERIVAFDADAEQAARLEIDRLLEALDG